MFDLVNKNRTTYPVVTLDVTATNWTTSLAYGRAIQFADGTWALEFNIAGSLSVAASTITLSVAGVTFSSVDNQAVAISSTASKVFERANTLANSEDIRIVFSATATTISTSGRVVLESKPTWIE